MKKIVFIILICFMSNICPSKDLNSAALSATPLTEQPNSLHEQVETIKERFLYPCIDSCCPLCAPTLSSFGWPLSRSDQWGLYYTYIMCLCTPKP